MTDAVKTLTNPIYTVQEQRWNTQHYPYWNTRGRWETVEQAVENLPSWLTGPKVRIIKELLQADAEGRITFNEVLVVLDEDDNWHPLYDPRKKDPDWREYVRLKEKFEDA